MWKKIKFLTVPRGRSSIQIIDIAVDKTVYYNKIKYITNLPMKTIDDPVIIKKLISGRSTMYLNQAQGTPLTMEALRTKLETDVLSLSRTTC